MDLKKEIKYLALGISNIINVFNPCQVVLASDIENFDIAVGNTLSAEVKKYFVAGSTQNCNIIYSALGNRAMLSGGCALVLSSVYENPGMLWGNKN